MNTEDTIVNKVANSSLINIDLEDYYPKGKRVQIDLAETLFQGLILREKDFRDWIKTHDWSQYKDAYVAVACSADAIIPVWAYMLVSAQLEPFAKDLVFGDLEALESKLYSEIIHKLDISEWEDQRLIIKGCGNLPVPRAAFLMLTAKLRPIAKSIMYGEACSTVPIYKS
jgi:S-adenosylmethionine/arginine decarboxylase-like enzyme